MSAAVTPTKSLPRATFANRNARLLELEAIISGPRTPEWEAATAIRMQHFYARRTGQTCGGCGRALTPSDPLWIDRIWNGGHGRRIQARFCAACVADRPKGRGWVVRPCEG